MKLLFKCIVSMFTDRGRDAWGIGREQSVSLVSYQMLSLGIPFLHQFPFDGTDINKRENM